MLRRLFILLGLAGFAQAVWAHDPGISSMHVVARPGAVEMVLQFSPNDLVWLGPFDSNGDGTVSRAEFEAGRPELENVAISWIHVSAAAGDLAVRFTGAQFEEAERNVVLRAIVPAGANETWKLIFPRFIELPPGHRQLVTVAGLNERVVAEQLISAQHPWMEVDWAVAGGRSITDEFPNETASADSSKAAPADATATTGPTRSTNDSTPSSRPSSLFGGFFRLGIEHILSGYDHLLFLAGLLLVCHRIRDVTLVITSFTLAHSITLALATFDILSIPSHIVEPLIAASILYVGLENIFRKGEVRHRWALTFAFGLIHGFGFAGALRELGIGANGSAFAVPLLAFNLGVEAGQIAVAAVFLPLLWWARRQASFERRGLPIMSGLVAAAGAYWLLQRLF